MKRTLLATTALVAFAGVAAADIEISGSAEMGIVGGDLRFSGSDGDGVTQFFHDVEVEFTMTGETDAGLAFGTEIDLGDAVDIDGGDSETADADYNVFISGGFGTLTLGDTDGALDWASTEAGNVGNPGTISDTETEHLGYNGSYIDGAYDGQILRYDNTFGNFGFAVSTEIDDAGDEDAGYALGLKFGTDFGNIGLDFGLGYQTAESVEFGNDDLLPLALPLAEVDVVGVTVAADFGNGFEAGLQYSIWSFDETVVDGDDTEGASHLGLGLGYETGPVSLHANYGIYDVDDADASLSGFAIAAAYDLGGGASAHVGYAISEAELGSDDEDADDFSIGLAFSF